MSAPRTDKGGWLKLPEHAGDVAVKPAAYLPIYEELLGFLRTQSFALLELGVWNGHSLAMWRDAFPHATVIGIDLRPPEIDLGPRVHIFEGDQADASLLGRLRAEHAPDGFDVIIDDASHLGVTTARSLQVLYIDHLRPGGLYMLEDWGTGYLVDWSDGGDLTEPIDVATLDSSLEGASGNGHCSFPSHDLGMVGVVKRLVDHSAANSIAFLNPSRLQSALPIEKMIIQDGIVTLLKPLLVK